jgi:hypothetical protein
VAVRCALIALVVSKANALKSTMSSVPEKHLSTGAVMPPSILLKVTNSEIAPGRIQGFRFLWAFYVNDYDPELHCQRCFRGKRVPEFCTATAESGRLVTFDQIDQYRYLYVCGVGIGRRRELRCKNFHFPLKYADGAIAEETTYNGYTFRAQNAVLLPIPGLRLGWEGWEGKTIEHVWCKNFQFAVAYLGYPPTANPEVGRNGSDSPRAV